MVTGSSLAIIGGGIIGTSIAWRLAQRGNSVTLFERGTLGREASWAAAGMLSPGGEIDATSDNAELLLESRRMYRGFVEELAQASGVAIDYQECGAIDLAYDETEWQCLLKNQERHAALGIRSRRLTPAQVQAFSPHANSEGLQGALFYPDDAVVSPRDLITALQKALYSTGVAVIESRGIDHIEVTSHGIRVGHRSFQAAVVSAGAWSSAIAVHGAPALPPVEPVRGHLSAYDLQLGACPTILRRGHLYAFQRSSGTVVAGASMERSGFDRAVDNAIAISLRQKLAAIMPILRRLDPVDVWTGFRPLSNSLHIGQWHETCLYLAYGHFRNGILLAPVTAERITSEVMASRQACASAS